MLPCRFISHLATRSDVTTWGCSACRALLTLQRSCSELSRQRAGDRWRDRSWSLNCMGLVHLWLVPAIFENRCVDWLRRIAPIEPLLTSTSASRLRVGPHCRFVTSLAGCRSPGRWGVSPAVISTPLPKSWPGWGGLEPNHVSAAETPVLSRNTFRWENCNCNVRCSGQAKRIE